MSTLTTQSWRRIGFWLVPALALLVLLPALDRRVANREQELRVLLTARNMAEGGSWMLPTYRGEPRYRKPPLMYWLTALSFKLAGTTESLYAGRLPAAIAGFFLVGIVYFGGRPLIGRRRALLGSLVCLSSFIFLRQARVAETDIPLALFTSLSVIASYHALTAARTRNWWLLAGLASGLGFLIKGPAAVAIPVLTVLCFAATPPRRMRHVFSPGALLALVLCLIIALPWYVALLNHATAAAQIDRELNATFIDSHHEGPWYYYLYTSLHALAPWGLLLPVAVAAVLPLARRHQRLRFLVIWFLVAFLSLSLISSKQIHYTTLLLAPCSLLVGWLLGFVDVQRKSWRQTVPWAYVRLLIVLTAAASAALPLALRWSLTPPMVQAFVFAFVAGLFALGAWTVQPIVPRTYLLVTAMSCWFLFAFAWGLPSHDKHPAVAEIASIAKTVLTPDSRVFGIGGCNSTIEFYIHRRVMASTTLQEAWAQARPGDVVIVTRKPDRSGPGDAPPSPALATRQRADLACSLYLMPPPTTPP